MTVMFWLAGIAAVSAGVSGWLIVGSLDWLSRNHVARLDRLSSVDLVELFLFVDPKTFVWVNAVALFVFPALAAIYFGVASAILVAIAVMISPSLIHRYLRVRRMRLLNRQLPDIASAIAAGLRSGLALGQALDFVVRHQPRPASQEFGLMMREHRIGLTLEAALENLSKRHDSRDLGLLVATFGVARDLGGGLAEALERFSATLRRRITLEDRVAALTAQGRLQGWIMGALPLVVGTALGVMDPGFTATLFGTAPGWITLAIVATLEIAGFFLIRRIVSIEV